MPCALAVHKLESVLLDFGQFVAFIAVHGERVIRDIPVVGTARNDIQFAVVRHLVQPIAPEKRLRAYIAYVARNVHRVELAAAVERVRSYADQTVAQLRLAQIETAVERAFGNSRCIGNGNALEILRRNAYQSVIHRVHIRKRSARIRVYSYERH